MKNYIVSLWGISRISLLTCLFLVSAHGQSYTTTNLTFADAFVRDGTYSSQNFGTDSSLLVKTASSPDNRDSYLSFSLGGIVNITNAKVRIFASLNKNGSLATTIYSVVDTNWTETGITWNNKPARISSLATVTVSGQTYNWYDLDVTSYVRNQSDTGSNVVSFALHNGSSSTTVIQAHSREAANPPRLVLMYTNSPPVVSMTAPANGTFLFVPPAVQVSATASDSDGTISSVAFYAGSTLIGTDLASPYTVAWNPSVSGVYALTARATDNNGLTRTSAPVNVTISTIDRDPGLVLYWKFDEFSGSSSTDWSGNTNFASLSSPVWVTGKIGAGALEMNGMASFASLASIVNTGHKVLPPANRPFSISMWIKPYSLPAPSQPNALIVNDPASTTAMRLTYEYDAFSNPSFRFWSSESLSVWGPTPGLTLNQWHHLVLTYNNAFGRIYLDGKEIGSGGGYIEGDPDTIYIGGGLSPAPNFNGAIDDLRIYRREISPPEFSLTGHWTFEEGTGSSARDSSGHENAGTASSSGWSSGRLGNSSAQFTGGNISVNNSSCNTFPCNGKPFSVSLWFNPDSLPASGERLFIGNEQAGVSGWRLSLKNPATGTNIITFSSTNGAGTVVASARTILIPGQWYKLSATYGTNQGARVYLDGALIATSGGTITNGTTTTYFGGGLAGTSGLLGRIDDVRTYSRELTWEEVALLGFWRLDESVNLFSGDSSGNRNHMYLSDSTWGTFTGKEGYAALILNTTSGRVTNTMNDIMPFTGGGFTLSMWIYANDYPHGYSGLATCQGAPNNGWRLAIYKDPTTETNAIRFWSTDNGGTLDLWASGSALTVTDWNRMDITHDGGRANVYFNGRRVGSGVGGIRGSTANFMLGGVPLPSGTNLNGRVDQVKVYNRALEDFELGPVAKVVWETVFVFGTTNLALQGFGPLGKTLTYAIVTSPTNGTLSGLSGNTITYENNGTKGPDYFTYTVSDGEFTSPPTAVALSVVTPHWLSPAGSGTKNGSSPANAWQAYPTNALDAIWQTNNYYDLFYYAAGDYQTTGWKYGYRGTAAPGCKHVGAGTELPNKTAIKLEHAWAAWSEGVIFGNLVCYTNYAISDGFEVHNMVLDGNAANNPKYTIGEPITFTVNFGQYRNFTRIVLNWDSGTVPLSQYVLGHARAYEIRLVDDNDLIYSTTASDGGVDDIAVNVVNSAGIKIIMKERGSGVDLYSLEEIEVFHSSNPTLNLALGSSVTAIAQEGNTSELTWDIAYVAARAVDGNFTTQWASGTQGMVGSLSVSGSNLKFINVKVIGFGTKAWKECFPFGIGTPCGDTNYAVRFDFGNLLVDNCVFESPATSNRDGCTVLSFNHFSPYRFTNGLIRNCRVLDIKAGNFWYSQAFSSLDVENCYVRNVGTGVYYEPDPGSSYSRPVFIRSNVFENVQHAIAINFHPNQKFNDITCLNNDLVLTNIDAYWGFVVYDNASSSVSNLVFLGNVVRTPDWSTTANVLGFHFSTMPQVICGNNVFVMPQSNALRVRGDQDPIPAGYRRAVFNNRDLTGTLLPVKNQQTGNNAVDQQWP